MYIRFTIYVLIYLNTAYYGETTMAIVNSITISPETIEQIVRSNLYQFLLNMNAQTIVKDIVNELTYLHGCGQLSELINFVETLDLLYSTPYIESYTFSYDALPYIKELLIKDEQNWK